MHTNDATPRHSRSSSGSPWIRRWPATTVAGVTALASLAALMTTSAPTRPLEPVDEEALPVALASEAEAATAGRAVRAETRTGLPPEVERAFLASPYAGDAFTAGRGDADVWGGLTGTEIGEAYGVGGLGVVGSGRGDSARSAGTLGKARKGPAVDGDGRYDAALQSRVLTAGTVDDNADPAGYQKAVARMAEVRAALGVDDAAWDLGPPTRRHVARPGALDIALVIDTTGSMGDELEYLKVELRDIARQVADDFPDVDQRWGLVVYRDAGDDYVTREFAFTGIDEFVAALGRQEASGGGDEPEAMDEALAASAKLEWRAGADTARMVFLVADAPSHAGDAARSFASAVREHRDEGTAIFPIAGSGVALQAEGQLRMAARATGGQYIFLTDHSGVGGHHEAPQVEQYKVESLQGAMLRMIDQELGHAKSAKKRAKKAAPVRTTEPVMAPEPVPTPEPMPEPMVAPEPVVVPAVVVTTVEAASPRLWDELKERLAAHLLFASSMAVLMFAALGLDALLARRRRVRRARGE